jgi:hypothetical protein
MGDSEYRLSTEIHAHEGSVSVCCREAKCCALAVPKAGLDFPLSQSHAML